MLRNRKSSDCRSNTLADKIPESGEVAQQKVLVFSLQFVVTLLALGKRLAFFIERLLKIANSFLKTNGHFRYGWPDGIAELNLELVFVGL